MNELKQSNCVTHFACDCITRKLIDYDKLEKENQENINALINQIKLRDVELEKVQQDKASNDSEYLKLSAENNTLRSKLKVAKDKLEISLSAIQTIRNFNLSKLKRLQIDAYLKKIDEV